MSNHKMLGAILGTFAFGGMTLPAFAEEKPAEEKPVESKKAKKGKKAKKDEKAEGGAKSCGGADGKGCHGKKAEEPAK